MITENLTVVANGDPDSRIDLDTNIGVNGERVMSKVRPAKVCRGATNVGADTVRERFEYLNSCCVRTEFLRISDTSAA
jgi:hypothetical protein